MIAQCGSTSKIAVELARFMARSWRSQMASQLPHDPLHTFPGIGRGWVDCTHRLNIAEAAADAALDMTDAEVYDPLLAASQTIDAAQRRLASAAIAMAQSDAAYVPGEDGFHQPNESMLEHLDARRRVRAEVAADVSDARASLALKLPPAAFSAWDAVAVDTMWPQVRQPMMVASARLASIEASGVPWEVQARAVASFADLATKVADIEADMLHLLSSSSSRRVDPQTDSAMVTVNALDQQQLNLIRAWLEGVEPDHLAGHP